MLTALNVSLPPDPLHFYLLSLRLDGTLGKPGMFLPGKHQENKLNLTDNHHPPLYLYVYDPHMHMHYQTKYKKNGGP